MVTPHGNQTRINIAEHYHYLVAYWNVLHLSANVHIVLSYLHLHKYRGDGGANYVFGKPIESV